MNETLIGASLLLVVVFAALAFVVADLIAAKRRPRTETLATETPEWLDLDFHSKCKRKTVAGVVPCLLCAGPCWGDMLDEANQRAEEARRARPVGNGEFAWLIERGSSPISSPSYFAGIHWGMGLPQWSKNNADAVRFANKEAAQRIADSFPPVKSLIPPHRITEHGWV